MANGKKLREVPQAIPFTGIEGLEGMSTTDLGVPWLQLLQPSSKHLLVPAGHYVLGKADWGLKELSVVFLAIRPGRIAYPGEGELGAPFCGSSDGVIPHPSFPAPPSPLCVDCPLKEWENGNPPECNQTYVALGLTHGDKIPFFWRVSSNAFGAMREWIRSVSLRRPQIPGLYSLKVELGTHRGDSKKGSYFVPTFRSELMSDYNEYLAVFHDYSQVVAQMADHTRARLGAEEEK